MTTTTDPSAFTRNLQGEVLRSRFEVGSRLGGGAMGEVYHGHDRQTDLPVAIKVLNSELIEQGASVEHLIERFNREIKLTARLRHPNIVRMVDSGATPEGTLYLVLELLEGRELRELLEDAGGPLETQRAAAFAMMLCDALVNAHEAGVIHRDLKPENVFVIEGDILKVVDFGIARLAKRPELTKAGAAIGTPQYMAPEQVMGSLDIDARADLYALGVMLFEMLTGELPFEGDSVIDIAMAQVEKEIPPLNIPWLTPDEQERWRQLIRELMAKDPDHRPRSAHEVRRRLRELAGDKADAHRIKHGIGASAEQVVLKLDGASSTNWLLIGAVVLLALVSALVAVALS